jgi:adenylosuccinate synthase
VLRDKLDALARHYEPLISSGGHSHPTVAAITDVYIEFAAAVRIAGTRHLADLAARGRLIFEGAQGVLLDEWRGFHPHTTWSTTTPANAQAVLRAINHHPGYVLGVLRAYQTRHGAGPFPSEDEAPGGVLPERHNGHSEQPGVQYQGDWRVGHLDPVALRYAIEACDAVDGLSLTHLDRAGATKTVREYRYHGHSITRLPLGKWRDLHHQAHLTKLMSKCACVLDDQSSDPGSVASELQGRLGVPVVIGADGPDRKNRSWSKGL